MTDEQFQLYDPEGRRKYLTAQERDAFLAASVHAIRLSPHSAIGSAISRYRQNAFAN